MFMFNWIIIENLKMETSKFSQLFHYWSRFSVWSNFSKQIKHQNLKNFENLQSQTIRRKCWHLWISFIPSILVTGCFVIFLLHNDYLNYYPFCLMVDFLPTDVHKNFSQALIILGTIHMMIIILTFNYHQKDYEFLTIFLIQDQNKQFENGVDHADNRNFMHFEKFGLNHWQYQKFKRFRSLCYQAVSTMIQSLTFFVVIMIIYDIFDKNLFERSIFWVIFWFFTVILWLAYVYPCKLITIVWFYFDYYNIYHCFSCFCNTNSCHHYCSLYSSKILSNSSRFRANNQHIKE